MHLRIPAHRRHLQVIAWLFLLAGPTAVAAQSGVSIPNCYVTLLEDVEVPAEAQGVVVKLDADEGVHVKAGDTLGTIDDRAARAQLELSQIELNSAKAEAGNNVRVRYAQATADVARAEYDAAKEANKRRPGAIAQSEIRRLALSVKQATLGIEQADTDQKLLAFTVQANAARVKVATDEVLRRQIRAPLNGVVVEIRRQAGEWVDPGVTVLQIVRMDRLRVEGFLNINEHRAEDVAGRNVQAKVDLGGGRIVTFPGKVTYVSPLIQAGGDYRIRAEVLNRQENEQWQLHPGQQAELVIVN